MCHVIGSVAMMKVVLMTDLKKRRSTRMTTTTEDSLVLEKYMVPRNAKIWQEKSKIRGKNQKLGSSSTSSTCCYVCVVRQGKLSPPSKPDKLTPFCGTSNNLRLQIKKPSTEAQFWGIRWARLTGLMDKKPTNIVYTIQRQAVSSRKPRFKSNRAVNLLSWG